MDEFGDAYRVYRQRTPMFVPVWGQWRLLVERARLAEEDAGPHSVRRR